MAQVLLPLLVLAGHIIVVVQFVQSGDAEPRGRQPCIVSFLGCPGGCKRNIDATMTTTLCSAFPPTLWWIWHPLVLITLRFWPAIQLVILPATVAVDRCGRSCALRIQVVGINVRVSCDALKTRGAAPHFVVVVELVQLILLICNSFLHLADQHHGG